MDERSLVLLPLVAWLASGLAAVALTPRNRAARSLLAAGALLLLAWVLEGASAGSAAAAALLAQGADACFLLGLAATVAVLTTYPRGDRPGGWARGLVVALALLAVAGPLLVLLGSTSVPLAGGTTAANPFAVPGLAAGADAGRLVVASEPLWLLLGFAILVARWRAARGEERRELGLAVAGLVLLVAMLAGIVAGAVTGRPVTSQLFTGLFLLALGLFPALLLVGISHRTRSLERALAASRGRLVTAEDEARRAIERDLHDGVQQQLVAMLSLTELAARQVDRTPREAAGTLADIRDLVHGSIEELRELVNGIRPPVLADSGVVAALASRLERLPAEVVLRADVPAGVRWEPETEAAAYFVACEAVTNALKHAPGAPVHVHVAGDRDRLVVEVRDAGPGLRDGTGPGRGLAGLQDRVDSLGGTLRVGCADGGGTVVRASLPSREAAR